MNSSETLKVFTSGATREGLAAGAAALEAGTGIGVSSETTHGHLIRDRVIAGDTDADIVLLPVDMVDDLARRGLVVDGVRASLGNIRIGAAVRQGCPAIDVSTMDALIQTIRAAKSIVITEAPSGQHMDALFREKSLTDEIAKRITRYDTGSMVNEHMAASATEGEIAFGVATEILFFRDKGVHYAGPVPDEVQMKLSYEAALLTRSDKGAAARVMMDWLVRPDWRKAFANTGVEFGG
jgi:molybdate transport system substrate-binding protein